MTSIYYTTITTILVVFSLFLFIVLANTIVYAQQVSPTPSNTPTQKPGPSSSLMPFPKLHAVKIISPTKLNIVISDSAALVIVNQVDAGFGKRFIISIFDKSKVVVEMQESFTEIPADE